MQQSELTLLKNIRRWLLFFMLSLILSGATAIDVPRGINWLNQYYFNAGIHTWLSQVTSAINITNNTYPYLFYGYDWLAFAHLVIAVAFIGPYQQPVRNIWVVQFGRLAALMIIPFAFIAGTIRGIPFWWQLVDCSFGIIALWPLTKCYWLIKKLEQINLPHLCTVPLKSDAFVKAENVTINFSKAYLNQSLPDAPPLQGNKLSIFTINIIKLIFGGYSIS